MVSAKRGNPPLKQQVLAVVLATKKNCQRVPAGSLRVVSAMTGNPPLRRISCHGKNHSHTRCEYSKTIFLCYHHYSEYSLLGSKFSTNLLFAASKCHVTIQRQWQFKMFKMAEGSDGCSGETLLALCTRKKRLQGKMTKDNYWIGVQENIGMFGKVVE